MTALAGVLGWSSHRTIVRVYDEATRLLASQGQPAPPNPFLLKPRLSLLSNMVVYVPLLGALLALVVGHLSVADDESRGIGRLIFSRPVTRSQYLMGRLGGAVVVVAAAMAAGAVAALAALALAEGSTPTASHIGRITLLYGLSCVYLMVFVLIGMVAVLAGRRRSLALLSAMGAWLVITFALPQFTSGLRPSAALNPVVDVAGTSQAFFRVTAALRSLSVVEQYKQVSGRILLTAPAEPVWHTALRVVPIVALILLLWLAALVLVRRHDFSRSGNGE
jgi:ABC-type transport system involved in multi-copper enzyme maturation permease subunit